MVSDSQLLEQATERLVSMLQGQFRKGILGEGIWRSKEPVPGFFVAVVRLPDRFVALDVKIEFDEEWTVMLEEEIT